MPTLRTLAHLLLTLALVAGGLPPGVPEASAATAVAASVPPCHATADEAVDPATPDCCNDRACTCDCLNSAAAGVLLATSAAQLPMRPFAAPPGATALPASSAAPEIRPPIG